MSDLREAAQQALWAFQCHVEQTWPIDRSTAAIAALRTALAGPVEPVPQPGGWMHPWPPVKAQQAEPKGGGNLPPPLQAHCPQMDLENKANELREAVQAGASTSDVLQMLLEVQALERERLAIASPDELMRLNGRMALCARMLIDGCLNAGAGYQAVANWDAARSGPNV